MNSQDEHKYVRKKALRIRNFRQFENVDSVFIEPGERKSYDS